MSKKPTSRKWAGRRPTALELGAMKMGYRPNRGDKHPNEVLAMIADKFGADVAADFKQVMEAGILERIPPQA